MPLNVILAIYLEDASSKCPVPVPGHLSIRSFSLNMKATLVMPLLAQGIAAGIVQRQQGSCTNDNCALAVSPLDARQAQIASDDCSSYLRTTLTVGVR